ncbi:MAG: DsbA family oxidoreductase [Actinobacteria bacterium]|nr:DsbA family oxidoreductase [Actinomycetota bacterium]
MSDVLTVHVWSDIACPWCTIGRVRFAKAIELFHEQGGEQAVEIEYHSFELSPDTPVDFDGSEADFLVGHKHIPAADSEAMLARVTEVAAEEGMSFDFARLQHTNTRTAHELLHMAKQHGLQGALMERLQLAYFCEGRHLGRHDELADLAAEVGLDRDEVLAALAARTYAEAVDADIAAARKYGVRALPFYLLHSRYGVSGAYPPEFYAEGLAKAAASS